jgi:hypothetical protein
MINPGPGEAAGILAHLKAERQTGCLEITSAAHGVCRVYLLLGRAFHDVGPSGEGDAALSEALAWPDATLSFDENVRLPAKQTVGIGRDEGTAADGDHAIPVSDWPGQRSWTVLTRTLIAASRRLLAGVLRFDIGAMMEVEPKDEYEERVLVWIRLSILTFYLTVSWLVIWPLAHLSLILFGSQVLHWQRGPVWLFIVVEVLPASMMCLALVRMSVALPRMVATIKAVGDAKGAAVPPPDWTQKGRLIQRLVTPSDIDLVAAVLLVVALELLVR